MAESTTAPSGGSSHLGKIFVVLFIVIDLLVVGGGAFLVYASTIGYKHKTSSEEQLNKEMQEFQKSLQQNPVIYTMEPFNTNLDGIPRRLVRMELSLEMLDEEGFEEVMNMSAEARDAVMHILNGTDYNQIETVQGKLQLKNKIIAAMNSFLDKGVVRNIYFSDFVVQ